MIYPPAPPSERRRATVRIRAVGACVMKTLAERIALA